MTRQLEHICHNENAKQKKGGYKSTYVVAVRYVYKV